MSERLDQLTAAILVGGQGTRLRQLTGGGQKVIAPVAGRPFLFRLLDQLADAGLRRVVLCTGHKAGDIAATVGESYRDMAVRYSPEETALGTAGALRHALSLFDSDPVLAMNGDSFCEVDLAAFFRVHQQSLNKTGTLVVVPAHDTRASGRVVFNKQGVIERFEEKPLSAAAGWISAGIYLLSRAVLESIPENRSVSIEKETFPTWVGRGLRAFPVRGRFLDIGTPAAYLHAQTQLR
jgi:NDP-sugar pyrophosphorylase family protein